MNISKLTNNILSSHNKKEYVNINDTNCTINKDNLFDSINFAPFLMWNEHKSKYFENTSLINDVVVDNNNILTSSTPVSYVNFSANANTQIATAIDAETYRLGCYSSNPTGGTGDMDVYVTYIEVPL